jgi:hypothetical protein
VQISAKVICRLDRWPRSVRQAVPKKYPLADNDAAKRARRYFEEAGDRSEVPAPDDRSWSDNVATNAGVLAKANACVFLQSLARPKLGCATLIADGRNRVNSTNSTTCAAL